MKKVPNKLQVNHFPQVPCKPFVVDVEDEVEAMKVINMLANQHIFLFDNLIIPDYSNVITVTMYEDGEWVDYWNEEEGMEWGELESTYFTVEHAEDLLGDLERQLVKHPKEIKEAVNSFLISHPELLVHYTKKYLYSL